MHQVLTSVFANLIKMLALLSAPQDLPYRPQLLWQVGLVYIGTAFLILQSTAQVEYAILNVLLVLAIQVLFTWGLLALTRKRARFIQTTTAIIGVSVIFNLISWPIFGVLEATESGEHGQQIMAIFFLMIMSWEVLVKGHIYHHALDMPMVSSLLVSISLLFVSIAVSQLLFPG
jgi:hypothetical protein